jgi:Na+-driven multidrug efflux pump
MKNHGLLMLIGCALPLLLIFLLPAFGVKGDWILFIFIILMFFCHLLMLGIHHKKHNAHGEKKEEKHGSH